MIAHVMGGFYAPIMPVVLRGGNGHRMGRISAYNPLTTDSNGLQYPNAGGNSTAHIAGESVKHSTCKRCSKPFRARPNKLFCSDKCRFAAWKSGVNPEKVVTPCFYCGLPADSIDHVPPKAVRPYLTQNGWAPLQFFEIDCCRECNSVLSAGEPYTPGGRKKKIAVKLKTRYKKYLEMPDWTESQIKAQGESFGIREALAIREITRKRIEWASS